MAVTAESSPSPSAAHQHSPSLWTCPWIVGITIIRILLIVQWVPTEVAALLDSAALRSTLVRPQDTLTSFRQARALFDMIPNVRQAYRIYSRTSHVNSPLLLTVLTPLSGNGKDTSTYWVPVVWGFILLGVDVLIALSLRRIARIVLVSDENSGEVLLERKMPEPIRPPLAHLIPDFAAKVDLTKHDKVGQEPPPPLLSVKSIPTVVAYMYYCSPATVLAGSVYHSIGSIGTLLVLWCFPHGEPMLAALCLSIAASCFDSWYLVFSIPTYLQYSSSRPAVTFLVALAVCSLLLPFLSMAQVGVDHYLQTVLWTPPISMPPSLSPLWYFWMQQFGRFRVYFHTILRALPWVLVTPLTTRLYRYPIVLWTCFWFLGMVLVQSHPTLVDLTIALCFLLLSPRCLIRMKRIPSPVALCGMPVCILLYVLDYSLWLESGVGNANYIYFQGLAYQVFVAIILLDFTSASLQRDKALRVTEKQGETNQ